HTFVLEGRRLRIEDVVARRTRRLVVVLEDIEDPHNAAAVLRTCEGFGVQEVHAIVRRVSLKAHAKVTRGCEKWLDLHRYESTEVCADALRARGYLLCAATLGEASRPLQALDDDRPLALLFGNERLGLSEQALRLADLHFKIPMLGFSQSLNVSVAVAVAVSHLVYRRLARHGERPDLTPDERRALLDRFCLQAAEHRRRIFRADPGLYLPSAPTLSNSGDGTASDAASRTSEEKT
ncbi:MAG: TrmH family RNA methyltransferase, partial [Myxococcales bacterium]